MPYSFERVTFLSEADEIVGLIFIPENLTQKAPAVVILGPFAYVKEQSPVQYATRLANLGFITLVFDARYHGESGGVPRGYEDPLSKVGDVKAALDYLQSRNEVNPGRIAALGTGLGCSEMILAAADDHRIQTLALVAGQYLDPESILRFLGGEEAVFSRLERGERAKVKFHTTGEVDFLPIVDSGRKDVALPHKSIWDWYHGWADRGLWENRYAVMSDREVWSFDVSEASCRLECPVLMIHSDQVDDPQAAKRQFEIISSKNKKIILEEDTTHFQFYDDPITIDIAVENIAKWFRTYLQR